MSILSLLAISDVLPENWKVYALLLFLIIVYSLTREPDDDNHNNYA